MAGKILRGAVVGASTLLGKELAEELNRAQNVAWDLLLLDTEEAGGHITAAGDEALVIQAIHADAFAGIDIAFFAGDAATTLKFWQAAHTAGAGIVDVTGTLEGQPNVLVRCPLIEKGTTGPQLNTVAVVSAHPVAILLGLTHAVLQPLGLDLMAATVLLPASELGSAGVDEVHQQTVGLLSFKPLEKDTFDAQVAFNIAASLGEAAKLDLHALTTKIGQQVGILWNGAAADAIALQLLQAPVFHGYTASIFVEMAADVAEASIRNAFRGGNWQLEEEQSPSNESVAGKDELQIRVVPANSQAAGMFWLWLAADNLRLAARNAAACALELAALRPMGGVH
jgi:aspartate-semialdehyde dehydrogenase